MANCKKCGKPVVTAPVYCPECQEKTGGWISVKDRLPDESMEGKEVIVCTKRRYDRARTSAVRWWGNPRFASWQDVTHWMPLPEPPGKEG